MTLRRLAAFLALTALIWCLDSAGTVIAGIALGLPISIPAAFLLIAGLSLGEARCRPRPDTSASISSSP